MRRARSDGPQSGDVLMWPMKGKTQRRHEIRQRISQIAIERDCLLAALRRLDDEEKRLQKADRKLGGV